jgi:MYXO-CTERM domain-containing protein
MNYEDGQDASYSCTDKNIAACSVDRIKDGSMPQGKGCDGVVADGAPNADVCVTESEVAILEAWLSAGQPEQVTSGGTDGGGDDSDPLPGGDGDAPGDETPGAEEGPESDDGGCQSTDGSLGGLMVLLAGLALFASRRRSVFDQ